MEGTERESAGGTLLLLLWLSGTEVEALGSRGLVLTALFGLLVPAVLLLLLLVNIVRHDWVNSEQATVDVDRWLPPLDSIVVPISGPVTSTDNALALNISLSAPAGSLWGCDELNIVRCKLKMLFDETVHSPRPVDRME